MDLKREHELGQTAEARKRTDRDLRCIGWGLVLLGVLMPALVTVENTGIYRTLMNGIYQGQEIYVLLAALKLVVLNAVRAYPHYMGVFFLVETFRGMELRRRLLASIAVVGILIPGVYLLINRIYGIRYDFGIPALSMIAMIWVLAKIDFSFVGLMKKGLMVAFFITALQFLDMMPLLWNFPFGRGESSYDIKLVSKFLQADSFLQAMATIFFALFLFMSVLLLLLVVDENNIRRISEQKELNEHMLMETRMRILENRTYMELRHLVHDLKSPLTSMQALVGVVKLSAGRRGDQTEGEYLERIETMIDRMSSMISEILHEEQRSVVTHPGAAGRRDGPDIQRGVCGPGPHGEPGSRGEDPDQQDPILPGAHQPGGERRLCGPEAGRQDLDQGRGDGGGRDPLSGGGQRDRDSQGAAGRDLGEGLLHPQLQRTGTEFRTASGGAVRRQCRTGERGAGGNGGHRLPAPL